MIEKRNHNKSALIILHEIYGINKFIEQVCLDYHWLGYDVFCPDMLLREPFSYEDVLTAYSFFMEQAGFGFYKKVEDMIVELKQKYEKVFLLGFSVGATIAWRCSENRSCDGIICCYGSRIRDYLSLQPECPVLLLFAKQDSFDVENVIEVLQGKPMAQVYKLGASHGFMDSYSQNFDGESSVIAKAYINDFIKKYEER